MTGSGGIVEVQGTAEGEPAGPPAQVQGSVVLAAGHAPA